jgi:YHS domain-containing protein
MLVRIVLFFVVGFFAYLLVRRTLAGLTARVAPRPRAETGVAQLVQDPQCGVYVDRAEAIQRKVPGGVLFFCSEKCAAAHTRARNRGAAG